MFVYIILLLPSALAQVQITQETGTATSSFATKTNQVDTTPVSNINASTSLPVPPPTTSDQIPPSLDPGLPVPGSLVKINATATTLNLRYRPPRNETSSFLIENLGLQLRLEYKREGGRWKTAILPPSFDPKDLNLDNLLEGVLYHVRMRTQQGSEGDQLSVSNSNEMLPARTKPLGVTRLEAIRSHANWSEATVTWNEPPLEAFRSKFDTTILTYYITGLPAELQKVFPRQKREFKTPVLLKNRMHNLNLTLPIIPGATYRFEVITKSLGIDATDSDVTTTTTTFKIPGPIDLEKLSGNDTSITVSWKPRLGVANTTMYLVEWVEKGSNKTINVTTNQTQVQITDLLPTRLYTISVRSIQATMWFGKLSEASHLATRTDPEPVSDVELIERSSGKLVYSFTVPPSGNYKNILVIYQTSDGNTEKKNASLESVPNQDNVKKATLSSLYSGALYRVSFVVLSEPYPQTNSTFVIMNRTIPLLPTNIQTSSQRGNIYISWRTPNMYPIAQWHYRIDYRPIRMMNKSQSICQTKGQDRLKVLLPGLEPGTGYAIYVTTIAGSACSSTSSNDYVTYSQPSSRLVAYTQPTPPKIKFWKQASLNSVRVVWETQGGDKESNFDCFYVEAKRIQSAKSYIVFERESLREKISKDQRSVILKLTQGAFYQLNVTTAVGIGEQEVKSMVVRGTNSIELKTWHRFYDQFPFPKLQWRFSSCGKSGRFGPSQVLCDASYKDTTLHQLVQVDEGVQSWIAPVDGLYRIVAAGAGYEGPGGLGAIASGLFPLKEGSGLRIAVGQRGRSLGSRMSVGGAGGSYVVADLKENQDLFKSNEVDILVVTGGAGSASIEYPFSPITNGLLSYSAGNGSVVGESFGKGGVAYGKAAPPGMGGESGTGGGAGYYGMADLATTVAPSDSVFRAVGFEPFFGRFDNDSQMREKFIPLSGGRYQTAQNSFSEGGFGGGGNGYISSSGGGGGYTGGGGGPLGGYSGGGGSYIKMTGGLELGEVTNNQPGYVIIALIGVKQDSPVPLTFYLVIAFVSGTLLTLLCAVGLYGVSRAAEKHFRKRNRSNVVPRHRPATISRNVEEAAVSSPGSTALPGGGRQRGSSFSSEMGSEEEGVYETGERAAEDTWRTTVQNYLGGSHEVDEGISGSLSSMSSVSSMRSNFIEDQVDVDLRTGKIRFRGRNVSKVTSSSPTFNSADENDVAKTSEERLRGEVTPEDLPTSSLPLELGNEKQKEEFRKKLKHFHKIAKEQSNETKTTTFYPSTNF